MKKVLMVLSVTGLFYAGLVHANTPGETCRDKNGKVVECKHSTSKNDSKTEKDLKTGANKVGKGAKHTGYDATHNKATKKLDVNNGNEKYKDQNDVK